MEFIDEPALATNPTKRRIMEEAQRGEVRRIHIIYYLCRKGRIEHPHLIRVHHTSRNGIHLRDVKRWLLELRGKEMADSFAWSFKRRYKKGFLWQDLVDEDLITPISDNEYILKGSEISSTKFLDDISPFGVERNVIIQNDTLLIDEINNKHSAKETPMDDLMQKMSEIDESPPQYSTRSTSTVTEDSIKLEETEDSDSPKDKKEDVEDEEKGEFRNKFENVSDAVGKPTFTKIENVSDVVGKPTFTRSKSRSKGSSSRFRSFITCRNVETMDSATIKVHKFNKISTALSNDTREICDLKRGICKINRDHISHGRKNWSRVKGQKKDENEERRTISAAYMPIHGPKCSQCGREFKPEKLHKHMKSCRGIKTFAKSDKFTVSVNSTNQDSQYLTHK